jgi:uncharacterized metal-binding protein
MSSGAQHEKVARWLPVISSVAAIFTTSHILGVCTIGQLIGVYCITPDVDINNLTVTETQWFKERKKILAFLKFPIGIITLILGWFPGIFLKHRGISHTPIIGAVVITFLIMVNPFVLALLYFTDSWSYLWTIEALAIWIGFCATHLIHIIQDRLT